jgi:hypothetical protein
MFSEIRKGPLPQFRFGLKPRRSGAGRGGWRPTAARVTLARPYVSGGLRTKDIAQELRERPSRVHELQSAGRRKHQVCDDSAKEEPIGWEGGEPAGENLARPERDPRRSGSRSVDPDPSPVGDGGRWFYRSAAPRAPCRGAARQGPDRATTWLLLPCEVASTRFARCGSRMAQNALCQARRSRVVVRTRRSRTEGGRA